MLRFFVVFCVALVGLSACQPVYQTRSIIVPPESYKGRMCSNSCLDKQNTCQASCRAEQERCGEVARLEGQNAYLLYVNERQKDGKEVERTQESFISSAMSRCYHSACRDDCGVSFKICHTNCGGAVKEERYCSAFCEEE